MDKISFPHLGDYSYFIKPFLENVTNKKVEPSPPITKKTIELGSKSNPDFSSKPRADALINGALFTDTW